MTDRLIAPTFLYRFSVPCPRQDVKWTGRLFELPDSNRLPVFGELEGRQCFADTRIAWNQSGLFVSLRVEGKKTDPWCRASRWEDSDGLSLWIATRDVSQVHRANRFCHRFILLPQGAEQNREQPVAQLMSVTRARETPKPIPRDLLKVHSEKRMDGYVLSAFLPAQGLTGFDPEEQSELGFFYAVVDREKGWQTFSLGTEFPFDADPSLWGILQLEP